MLKISQIHPLKNRIIHERRTFQRITGKRQRRWANLTRRKKKASCKFPYDSLDIKHIREKYNLTQEQFAVMLGISECILRNWEEGRCVPDGPAMFLLRVVDRNPEVIQDILGLN
jgi:putative transcriptional regulator